MPNQGPNRKPNQATKDRIIELAREGLSNTAIARDLNVHSHTVNGIISNARRRGLLPQISPKAKPETVPMPIPQPAIRVPDDFAAGRTIVGAPGGFRSPSMEVRYLVERTIPADGLLGSHFGSFSVDELGQNYGEGMYKVTRHEPGRALPVEFVQKISDTYGPPRFPRSMQSGTSDMKSLVIPTKAIERSILNRLTECRHILDAISGKMKQKNCDPADIKGETEFLLAMVRDIDSLLEKLARNPRTKTK